MEIEPLKDRQEEATGKLSPAEVLERFRAQLENAPIGLRKIIDKKLAAYAKRNHISYQRATEDPTSWRGVARRFLSRRIL